MMCAEKFRAKSSQQELWSGHHSAQEDFRVCLTTVFGFSLLEFYVNFCPRTTTRKFETRIGSRID